MCSDKHVLIYGAGTMGSGIACCAALAGEHVVLCDQSTDAAAQGIERTLANMEDMCLQGLCRKNDIPRAMANISTAADPEAVCMNTGLVIEAVYENLALKRECFARLDSIFPASVPILSNTSGLRITDIAADMKHPERALTAHFWLPATLIPLVEIVVGERSSPSLAEEIKRRLIMWGKQPVIVKRDLPGQLANRILQAVIREAVNIVEIGLASAEDVDTAIKMGMALRLPVWGPLEHVDAVGFDICQSVQDTVLPEISGRKEASPLFDAMRREGHLGYKTGKGFYDWSLKDMDAMVARRNAFIVHALKKIMTKEGSEPVS